MIGTVLPAARHAADGAGTAVRGRERRSVGLTALYVAGLLAPPTFLASVVVGGMRTPGFSHLADPVSELGMSGAAEASPVNAAWAVTGVLVALLGVGLWLDRAGPGRVTAALVMLAGAASAAIALWFPMDPPGVPTSSSQVGHGILVAVAGLAFAAALVVSARSAAAPRWYRRGTWAGFAALIAGGVGAALAGAMGWSLVGLFERTTQAGYHAWLLMTAAAGLTLAWSRSRGRPPARRGDRPDHPERMTTGDAPGAPMGP